MKNQNAPTSKRSVSIAEPTIPSGWQIVMSVVMTCVAGITLWLGIRAVRIMADRTLRAIFMGLAR